MKSFASLENRNIGIDRNTNPFSLKRYLIFSVLIIALIVIVYFIFYLHFFDVNQIEIKFDNNSIIKKEEILTSLNGLNSTNIFSVSENKINAELKETYPFIDKITVDKHYPKGLTINIITQNYNTIIYGTKNNYYYSNDGILLFTIKNNSQLNLEDNEFDYLGTNLNVDDLILSIKNSSNFPKLTTDKEINNEISKQIIEKKRNQLKSIFNRLDYKNQINFISYSDDNPKFNYETYELMIKLEKQPDSKIIFVDNSFIIIEFEKNYYTFDCFDDISHQYENFVQAIKLNLSVNQKIFYFTKNKIAYF